MQLIESPSILFEDEHFDWQSKYLLWSAHFPLQYFSSESKHPPLQTCLAFIKIQKPFYI